MLENDNSTSENQRKATIRLETECESWSNLFSNWNVPPADIIKFRQSIGKKCENSSRSSNPELKLTVIADLVSFNKKRDRVVYGIKRRDMILQRSLASARAKAADNELVKLTKLEEKFADVNTLIRLPGKGGKVVPVLVPPDTLKLIDIMINDEYLKNQPYFFQTESGKFHYRSAEALNKFAKGQRSFESIWRLQQFLNLPQHQMTWVADFLGHVLKFHDTYYKMHTDAVNLAKVTKLLYVVDSGKLENAYAKDLDTIQPTLEDGVLVDSVRFAGFENLTH